MMPNGPWGPAASVIAAPFPLRLEGWRSMMRLLAAKAVLKAVSWCGGRFGVSRIVDLLRGSRSKALLAYGAEGCPSYGAYQAWSKPSMTRLVKDSDRVQDTFMSKAWNIPRSM